MKSTSNSNNNVGTKPTTIFTVSNELFKFMNGIHWQFSDPKTIAKWMLFHIKVFDANIDAAKLELDLTNYLITIFEWYQTPKLAKFQRKIAELYQKNKR